MRTLLSRISFAKEESTGIRRLKLLFSFVFTPYFNRVKLGEGGLVVFNLAHSIYAHHEVKLIALEFVLSFFVMCALYGFNDYTDRYNDTNNKKKNKSFIYLILQNEMLFISVNLMLTTATILFSFFFLDLYKVPVVFLAYLANFLYSKKFKSVPVVDIIMVMVWGGLFVSLSGKLQLMPALTVGLMTGIAHMFQMMTDKSADRERNIKTTLMVMPEAAIFFLSAICITLGGFLFLSLGIWWALTCFIPVLVYAISRHVTFSWHVSRAYFFICWLALLTSYYGSL